MREIVKLVTVLSLICGISAATLQAFRINLEPKIEKQNDLYIRGPALERLFDEPASRLLENKMVFNTGEQQYPIFYKKDGNNIIGLAIEAVGKGGYGGDIALMIGVDVVNHKLLGLEIINHSETPGVGAKIEKESFRKQWQGYPSDQPMKLKRDGGNIQALTGATYSSRAVIDGCSKIYELVNHRLDEIIGQITKAQNN